MALPLEVRGATPLERAIPHPIILQNMRFEKFVCGTIPLRAKLSQPSRDQKWTIGANSFAGFNLYLQMADFNVFGYLLCYFSWSLFCDPGSRRLQYLMAVALMVMIMMAVALMVPMVTSMWLPFAFYLANRQVSPDNVPVFHQLKHNQLCVRQILTVKPILRHISCEVTQSIQISW